MEEQSTPSEESSLPSEVLPLETSPVTLVETCLTSGEASKEETLLTLEEPSKEEPSVTLEEPSKEETCVTLTEPSLLTETSISSTKIDKTIEKERQFQEARQLWAIFDAMGSGKAPKKCERPFTGRQQELYQECVALTTEVHLAELKNSMLKTQYDQQLLTMETLFLARALEAVKDKKEIIVPGATDYVIVVDEMNLIQAWYFELAGFLKVRKRVAKKGANNAVAMGRLFQFNDLCRQVSLTHSLEESVDILTLSTCRQGKDHQFTVCFNTVTSCLTGVDYLNLDGSIVGSDTENQVDCIPKQPGFHLDELRRILAAAVREKCPAQMLIRQGIWTWLDKMEKSK